MSRSVVLSSPHWKKNCLLASSSLGKRGRSPCGTRSNLCSILLIKNGGPATARFEEAETKFFELVHHAGKNDVGKLAHLRDHVGQCRDFVGLQKAVVERVAQGERQALGRQNAANHAVCFHRSTKFLHRGGHILHGQ